jgi:hypothetical protein
MAASSLAQNQDDLQKQLAELKATLQTQARTLEAQGKALERLEGENADLKSQSGSDNLDTEINRLNERMASATTLRSCASQIRLGGEFRFRGYYVTGTNESFVGTNGKGGSAANGDFDGFYGDMRTRLNFQYDFGCDVTAFAELQSHEAFGESQDGPFSEWDGNDNDHVAGNVGMYQTWLELRNVFSRPELSARIGRQEVVLGNQFQFGNADWYNGVVHDGLRVDWKSNCWGLTLLAMKLTSEDGDFNQLPSYFGQHDDDELYSAYLTFGGMKNISLDLYWIYINGHGGFAQNSGANDDGFFGNQFLYPGANAYFSTFGARLGGTLKIGCGLDWNVEGAYQTGTSHTGGVDVDIDSFAVEAEIGYTFNRGSKFRIFARGLFAEGPDTDGTGYLILYPNRHSNTGFRARYGLADLIPMTNVQTVQLGFHFDPACNWTLGATGLWADTETDIGGSSGYGEELDIWAEYRYSQQVTLGLGLAFVFPDDGGQIAWAVTDDAQFVGYVQARLVF